MQCHNVTIFGHIKSSHAFKIAFKNSSLQTISQVISNSFFLFFFLLPPPPNPFTLSSPLHCFKALAHTRARVYVCVCGVRGIQSCLCSIFEVLCSHFYLVSTLCSQLSVKYRAVEMAATELLSLLLSVRGFALVLKCLWTQPVEILFLLR